MKKNILIATASIVAIAALAQYIGSSKAKKQSEKIKKPIIAVADLKGLDEISIRDSKNQVTLIKNKNQWLVKEKSDFPADPKKLNRLFMELTTSKIDWLVSKDPAKLARFKLLQFEENPGDTGAIGTRVLLRTQGTDHLNLIVGKQRQPPNENPAIRSASAGTYIRIAPEPVVYLVKEYLTFDSKPSLWTKKDLLQIKKDEIKSIQISQGNNLFELNRESKEQGLKPQNPPKSKSLQPNLLKGLLDELGNFTILDVLPQSSTGKADFQTRVRVELFDQTTYIFELAEIKKDKKTSFWVQFSQLPSGSNPTQKSDFTAMVENRIFLIDEWRARKWMKPKKDFFN